MTYFGHPLGILNTCFGMGWCSKTTSSYPHPGILRQVVTPGGQPDLGLSASLGKAGSGFQASDFSQSTFCALVPHIYKNPIWSIVGSLNLFIIMTIIYHYCFTNPQQISHITFKFVLSVLLKIKLVVKRFLLKLFHRSA